MYIPSFHRIQSRCLLAELNLEPVQIEREWQCILPRYPHCRGEEDGELVQTLLLHP